MGIRVVLGILLVLVLAAGVTAIVNNAYHVGVARGLAESGNPNQPSPGVAPYPYYGPFWHYGYGPFGFGFGFLFPLLFFFLFFALLKGLFWHPWRGYGRWGKGVPPAFEEWHRRAHEEKQDRGTV
jgi:hypothetical protein